MADNTIQGGSDTLASDDIAGVKHQRVKIEYGADGSATDVSTANPLPVLAGSTAAPLPVAGHGGGGYIDENGVKLTVKRASVNLASATTNGTVVAAVAAKKIRVLSLVALCGNAATNLGFTSDTTAISPTFQNGANSGMVLTDNPRGWFETTSGEALNGTTSASGVTTGVHVVYVEV